MDSTLGSDGMRVVEALTLVRCSIHWKRPALCELRGKGRSILRRVAVQSQSASCLSHSLHALGTVLSTADVVRSSAFACA